LTNLIKYEFSILTKTKRGRTTMAEEIKGLEATQETSNDAQPTIEEQIAQAKADAYAEAEGKYKNEISTRDSKLTQYQKDLKAKMSDEERIKAESEAERKEWLEDIAKTKADALSLDDKHSALIKGNSKDEINAAAELVKSFKDSVVKDYEKQIKALTEELTILKANGSAPRTGATDPTDERSRLINEYNEAEKRGDGGAMFEIKERIRKIPK
jgi:LPS O-antigen subunit length determinant protein (WzzB/FepE family)